jgi:hypothetical protein
MQNIVACARDTQERVAVLDIEVINIAIRVLPCPVRMEVVSLGSERNCLAYTYQP